MQRRLLAFILVLATGAVAAADQAPVLQKGDHLAIVGDSITEQKMYSRFIATYLAVCQPQLGIDCAQFGWGGETAGGFVRRLDRSLTWFSPTVVTTCYGMNDGGYKPYAENTGAAYVKNMEQIISDCQALGVRTVVVGAPGAVDTTTYRRNNADVYNATLAQLSVHACEIAVGKGMPYADVHAAMIAAMAAAKAAYGDSYHVAGGDGVHPSNNGHVVMAYAFLKALAVNGEIARITLTMDGTATASEGHAVDASKPGEVTITSSRYPYVLTGTGKTPNDASSIAPFVRFREDLDRFLFIVPDCPWPKAHIAWGEGGIDVTQAELAAGVNLATLAKTPFDEAFTAVDRAMADLQGFETFLVKQILCMNVPSAAKDDPDFAAAQATMVARLCAIRAEKQAAVQALVKPVTHTITITEAAAESVGP